MARYEKGHKATTHQRLVTLAARRFREAGLSSVGVASLMGEAGLTHGGFYAHFPSKEALIQEALVAALGETRQRLADAATQGGLEALICEYLSPIHRDNPGGGCAIAALGAEVAREPQATRSAYAKQVQALIDLLATQVPPNCPEPKDSRSPATLACMLGALLLSRAMMDPAQSDAMLKIGVQAALHLAQAQFMPPQA